jgi:hypothetical protein
MGDSLPSSKYPQGPNNKKNFKESKVFNFSL